MKDDDISSATGASKSASSGSGHVLTQGTDVKADIVNAVKNGRDIIHDVRKVLGEHGVPADVAIVILGTIALKL